MVILRNYVIECFVRFVDHARAAHIHTSIGPTVPPFPFLAPRGPLLVQVTYLLVL